MKLRKMNCSMSSLLIFLCLIAISLKTSGFSIIKNGKASAKIVIPAQPSQSVQRAAWELNHHLQKGAGVKLKVIKESELKDPNGNLIVLGNCDLAKNNKVNLKQLKRNGYIIRLQGNKLFMQGRDKKGDWKNRDWIESGTLSAVYDFLRNKMNVRWLWPGKTGEFVPQIMNLKVSSCNKTFNPPLRSSHFYPSYRRQKCGWSSEKARKKFVDDEMIWERRHGFSWDTSLRFGHSFEDYWKRFGKTHKEYFNLLPDGSRRPDPYHICGGSGSYITMCWSSKAFQKQVIDDWKNRRSASDPNLRVGDNDSDQSCCCQNCMKWDVPDPKLGFPWKKRLEYAKRSFAKKEMDWTKRLGSLSDRYARFCLEMQKLVRNEDAEALIVGLGYDNYTHPPIVTKLNKDIIIHYVSPVYFPLTQSKLKEFKSNWIGWKKAGASLIMRPNFMLDGHCMPIFTARKVGNLIGFCYQNSMIGTEFDSNTGQYGTQGPNLYVLATKQLMPGKPVAEILDDFYNAFGPSKGLIKQYFEHWEKISDNIPKKHIQTIETRPIGKNRRTSNWNRFYVVASLMFTPDTIKKGQDILEAALKKAGNDKQITARIMFLYKGLKNAELTLATQKAFKSNDKMLFHRALEKLDKYRKSIECENVANMGFLASVENALWNRSLIKVMNKLPGTPLKGGWKFNWDPQKQGIKNKWYSSKFNDSQWYNIGTDSSWEEQPVGKKWKKDHNGIDYDGIAWYRNSFEIPFSKPGNKYIVRLTFGAVDEACIVWINGKKVLTRPFPFKHDHNSWRKPFVVDISKYVKLGKVNTIAVRVEDNSGAGGIWRPVWLKISKLSTSGVKNLIPNGNFELKNKNWHQNVINGSFKFSYDNKNAFRGKYSGLIECYKVNQNGKNIYDKAYGRWYQLGISVIPGKKYCLRAWFKTDKAFSGRVNVCVDDKGIKGYFAKLTGTNGLWSEIEIKDIIPKNKTVNLYLSLLQKTGRVWFDNVELIPES